MKKARLEKIEVILLCACAAILAAQLFVPPTIGLADNLDFGRVYSRFSLAHIRGAVDNFAYFAPQYWFTPDASGQDNLVSSEMALAAVPILLTRALGAAVFDIRWLGLVHAILLLTAYFALLVFLRKWDGWRRILLAVGALWIFGDVAYVAYCNSFFSDTAAMLGVLLMVPLALQMAGAKDPPESRILLLTAASLLFIGSKPQHAVVGILPVVVILWMLRNRILAILLLGVLWMGFSYVPLSYAATPLYNLIFDKIAKRSTTPQQDLLELGLSARDAAYVRMRADNPQSPANDPEWMKEFARRTGYRQVLWFYLKHPIHTARILAADLRLEAFQIRPATLGNFRRQEGLPPGTLSHHFNSWSKLRSAVFIRWPWHVVLWYALFFGFGIRLARTSRMAGIAVAVAAMGAGEFAVASLADAAETFRHLFLFHLLTDVTILIGVGWLLSSGLSRAIRRDTAGAPTGPLHASS